MQEWNQLRSVCKELSEKDFPWTLNFYHKQKPRWYLNQSPILHCNYGPKFSKSVLVSQMYQIFSEIQNCWEEKT